MVFVLRAPITTLVYGSRLKIGARLAQVLACGVVSDIICAINENKWSERVLSCALRALSSLLDGTRACTFSEVINAHIGVVAAGGFFMKKF